MGKPTKLRPVGQKKKMNLKTAMRNHWQLYVLVLPAIIYFFVFNYMPLYGIQIAFKDYKAVNGIAGSAWVGLKHFKDFFNAYYFQRLLVNTLLLNVYNLLWSFPVPLILAILLNQIRSDRKKRFIQTSIYVPYFISTVVLAGMLYIFLSPTSGIVNLIRTSLGMTAIDYMSDAGAFRTLYILSGIWQSAGYGTILYIATLSGVDPSLYEAAEIDGANRFQKMRYISLPHLIPLVCIFTILGAGSLINGNFDLFYIIPRNSTILYETTDILNTYVYRALQNGTYAMGATVGLVQSVVGMILVLGTNLIVRKISPDNSMF